jgi:undecaprenyl diphosphate synthase
VAAAQAAACSGEEITEGSLQKHFWSADMPDPDIIVRTSGEERLSNFLLWQAAYSELFFIKPHWPDFSEKLLDEVLEEYASRERRKGK